MQKQLIKTNIKEIFTSLQGEGPYLGQKQTFIRFCKCNLNCKFCDTDFSIQGSKIYSTKELYDEIKNINSDVLSFTGAEPLLETDFLFEFLSNYKNNKTIYLETNGTLVDEFKKVVNFVDIVSMDIKIESATGEKNRFFDNDRFINVAFKNNKEIFVKVVFDNNITDDEINSIIQIALKYNILIVLQPKMPLNYDIDLMQVYDNFYSKYKNVRLIPQTHKFLNLQ